MSDLLQMSKNVIEWVRKKPFCKMYPVVPGKVYDRTRGCVMNDASKCTLCTVCQIKCPTGAIKVDRAGGTWEINHFQCIMCNECVSNCRPKSLTMENKHAAPVAKMEKLSIKVELKYADPSSRACWSRMVFVHGYPNVNTDSLLGPTPFPLNTSGLLLTLEVPLILILPGC